MASQAEAVYHIVMGGKGAFGTANGALPPALNPKVPVRPEVLAALAGVATPPKIHITNIDTARPTGRNSRPVAL